MSIRIVKSLLVLVLVASLSPVAADAAPKETAPKETAQIEALIEAFRTSIIDKDKARFMKLFLHDKITWQAVTSEASMQRIRQKQPKATKSPVDFKENHIRFIDNIIAEKERTEEKFWNVKIDTDGEIASVSFDYAFIEGTYEINRGKEAWHLVNTESGWKIASVIWSMTFNPQPRTKAQLQSRSK